MNYKQGIFQHGKLQNAKYRNLTKLFIRLKKAHGLCEWKAQTERGRYEKSHPPPFSELLGGTVGYAFSHMHTYPPHSSWTDNWTVLWRIWTLKGNLSHLIIGIQRMLFICINTNKTHSLAAQREPALKRKSYYKTPISLWNWTKDFRWRDFWIYSFQQSMSELDGCVTVSFMSREEFSLLIFWTRRHCSAMTMPGLPPVLQLFTKL